MAVSSAAQRAWLLWVGVASLPVLGVSSTIGGVAFVEWAQLPHTILGVSSGIRGRGFGQGGCGLTTPFLVCPPLLGGVALVAWAWLPHHSERVPCYSGACLSQGGRGIPTPFWAWHLVLRGVAFAGRVWPHSPVLGVSSTIQMVWLYRVGVSLATQRAWLFPGGRGVTAPLWVCLLYLEGVAFMGWARPHRPILGVSSAPRWACPLLGGRVLPAPL